jgi:hypothetical protein
LFGVDVVDGKAGYMEVSAWPHHRPSDSMPLHEAAKMARAHMLPFHTARPMEAGPFAFVREFERDEEQAASMEDDGQTLLPEEAAAFEEWLNDGGLSANSAG